MSPLWIAGFSLAFSGLVVFLIRRLRPGPDVAGLAPWQAFLGAASVVAIGMTLFSQFPRAWGPFLAAVFLAGGAVLMVAQGRELAAGGKVDRFARVRPLLAGSQLVVAAIIVIYALLTARAP